MRESGSGCSSSPEGALFRAPLGLAGFLWFDRWFIRHAVHCTLTLGGMP